MDMNLLEYSRWGGSEPPEEVEADGPLVRFSEYDTKYLILTDSAKTAADLSSQLSKESERRESRWTLSRAMSPTALFR